MGFQFVDLPALPSTSVASNDILAIYDSSDSTLKQVPANAFETKLEPIKSAGPAPVVTIDDGYAAPVKSLVANVEPIQDLHGYDKPWVGGAWKNMFIENSTDSPQYVGNYYVNDSNHNYSKSSNNNYNCFNVAVSDNTEYCISLQGANLSTRGQIRYLDSNKDFLSGATVGYNARMGTFTTPLNCAYIEFSISKVSAYNELCVNISDSSFNGQYAPYSNICPISGRTESKVTDSGKNLLNPNDTDYGNYTITGTGSYTEQNDRLCSGYYGCKPNTTYVLSTGKDLGHTNGGIPFGGIAFFDIYKNFLSRVYANDTWSISATSPSNAYFVRAYVLVDSPINPTVTLPITPSVYSSFNMQLEEGEATAYEPYNGNTATIDLNGTRYGGTVNFKTGKLIIDRVKETFDWSEGGGESVLGAYTRKQFKTTSLAVYPPSASKPQLSSVAPYKASYNEDSLHFYVSNTNPSTGYNLNMYLPTGTTSAIFDVCYELATPIEIQLTPAELELLDGYNNVWCDSGDVELTYKSGTLAPIWDQITAQINSLDASEVGGTNKYIKSISESNGVITAVAGDVDTDVTRDSTNLITSGAVYAAMGDAARAMVFKGSLGEGGTITSLPEATSVNDGWMYKVITDGTYASQVAKLGDLFISDGTDWVLIPSGDKPSGTVTNVAVSNGGGLSVSGSPITSSGTITISHADTSSQESITASGRTYVTGVTLDTYGHVTGLTTGTETVTDTDRYVNSASFADDSTNNNVKMTLTRAGSDTATVTANIPKVSSTSAGVVPKGASVSTQSQTTKFLREDGTWAAPSYTTDTNTHRPIQVNGAEILGDNVTALNLKAGSNVTVTNSSGTVTIAATDTTYSAATTAAAGLMSAADKIKLNGVATGAEVNQNAFSNVAVGSTVVAADTKTDTLTLAAGSNITLTPDTTNDKITIAATDTTYESKAAASGGTAVSLVTTGEKYTWNNKSDLTIGNTSTTAAAGNHTHGLSLASDTGTSSISLAANSKYKLTAGGSTYVFTTPTDTTYESKAAASGGTAVSLVTTGEKYTWNNKTSNTGTVTKVSTGVGLTGGDVTTTGTIKAKLRSETALTNDSAAATETSGRVYPVAQDKSGYLAVNVPWTDTNTWRPVGTGATDAAAGNHTHSLSLATSTGTSSITLSASSKYLLTAGGSTYIFTTPPNTRYDADAVCSTTASTAAKVASATGYVLRNHNRFTLRLTVANTAASALTLNVNSTGAKTIYIDGAASSSSNYTLPAGDYSVYYNDSIYYIYTDATNTVNPLNVVTYSDEGDPSTAYKEINEVYNGSANVKLRFRNLLTTVPASGWSSTADANGYYTQTVRMTQYMCPNAGIDIRCIGSTFNTLPTAAQIAAYNLVDKFVTSDSDAIVTFTAYAKTKPTTTFYISVSGVHI